jgi:hypothetical protein
MHTSTNKSHKGQLLTTAQLTWARARAHTHTQTLEASQTPVAISDLGFFWLLVFSGCVWMCVCLDLYAIPVFPRFLCAVKCAVAGSLIATGVWLASRVYVCVRPG